MTWKRKRHYPLHMTAPAWYGPGVYGPHLPNGEEDPKINDENLPLSADQFGGNPPATAGHVDTI